MHTGRKNCLSLAVRLVATVVVLVGMVAADAVLNAANANGRNVTSHGRSGGMALDIPINKSDVLRSSRAFFEVAVGNPEIADVQVLGERSLYVFGRKFGSTSVTLSDNAGRIIAVVDVNVIHDVGRVKRMLHQLMPKERIAVRAANDGLVLSGTVSSSAIAANAMTIAERFAPDAVSNLMNVQGSQQVMLAVKFVEMRRDAIKRLGVNSAGSVGAGAVDIITDLTTALISPASTAQIGLGLTTGRTDIVGFLDMLEDRGVVRTLAEPTLVAMSGDSADFLAGGEFPVPVGATDGEIKIEFKNFGVGLSFTPTVLSNDRMNLKLFMEVSEPDETQDLTLAGVQIPGLTVRRATTTVELNNAESFAVAGLLSENFADNVEQIPFLGDIPILGALTRSTQYQTNQTELVMIVTPYLVKPVPGDQLRTPTLRTPSEQELFLGGTTEHSTTISPQTRNAAGFSGAYGYSTW